MSKRQWIALLPLIIVLTMLICLAAVTGHGQDFSHVNANGIDYLNPNFPWYAGNYGSSLATSSSNKDSQSLKFCGSLWNSGPLPDCWAINVKENSSALTIGSDLMLNHSSVSNGAGRFQVLSDVVIGPPGSATVSQNYNSFSFDAEGSYFDGANAQNNLWEWSTTTTPASGATINSRFNLIPLFTATCAGCTADFTIGGTGTLQAQGDYTGAPMWRFVALPRDGFTASFNHTLTAHRSYSWPDATGTVQLQVGGFLGIGTLAPGVPLHILTSGSGAYPQAQIQNTATGGTSFYYGVTDSGNGSGGGKYEIGNTTSSGAAAFTIDSATGFVGINQTAPGSRLDVNGAGNFTGSVTVGGGSAINKILNSSTTLTYTAVAAQTCQEQTVTVTGASATNFGVFADPRATLGSNNLTWSAWVSSANTVSVRVCNPTAGSITPNAVAWGVTVNQ